MFIDYFFNILKIEFIKVLKILLYLVCKKNCAVSDVLALF